MIERRQSKSGVRYEVRLRGPDGKERSRTFRARKDAERYEREQRAALDKGAWIDPRHASLTTEDYANRWIAERHDLRPRTVELYRSLLRVHILPSFGKLPLGKVAPTAIRAWNATLAAAHPVTAAKAYRLLREVLSTAVADELIARNPCVVKNAGQERSPERPMASVAEVEALATAMPDELRPVVLLAAWCHLRRAELLGLERRDVDLLHGTIRIERTANHVPGGIEIGPPKSAAGARTVAVPPHVLPALERHLTACVAPDGTAPLFTGPQGGRVRPAALQKAWDVARRSIGRPELHLHDLRHAGATWLAISGATTRELMARVGHASPAAALRYQHATEDRDVALAEALSGLSRPAAVASISDTSRDIRGTGGDAEGTSAASQAR
ncbi:MAG: tyrosine-type recombinase/integrase [Acidimicrobiales bacterium]